MLDPMLHFYIDEITRPFREPTSFILKTLISLFLQHFTMGIISNVVGGSNTERYTQLCLRHGPCGSRSLIRTFPK